MPEKKLEEKRKKIKYGIIIAIGVYIIVPIVLYIVIDKWNIIFSNIEASDWLSFWATYISGTLGGLATLVAVYFTIKQSYDQLKEEHKNRENEIKEERKYIYSPYLSVRIINEDEINENDKVTEINRFVFFPETEPIVNNSEKHIIYLEIENNGFGPATNIFMLYDDEYVVNGVNLNCQKNFLLKECFNIGKERKAICKLILYIDEALIKNNIKYRNVLTVDLLHQDILGNIIRRRICLSLNNNFIFSEQNLEYLCIDEIKKEYPHIQNIGNFFTTKSI